ncbi:MAG TPA: tetratricopeptide repeat protein [Thermoanaerobaculia bacterium]|nr:tetratricopeptide repeat protein [Thermoanaerobaculia bacterium]
MMGHFTEDELLTAAEDHPHLASCASCRRDLDDFRTFTSTLASARVWQESEPSLPGSVPSLAFLDVTARLENDQERTRSTTTALLENPGRAAETLTRAAPTPGLLSAAITAAHDLLDTNPEHAYRVTIVAEHLAGRIDWTPYPAIVRADHRGRLLKERATALRHLGRHHDALEAVEQARREYAATLAAAHPMAVLDYIQAVILREQGRLAEARDRVQLAAMTFEDFDDRTRLLHCRLLEGVILAAGGNSREARTLFLELLPSAQDDLPVRAQLHNNIGQLSIELGEHDLAANHLLQALALYRDLGMTTEGIRTNWGLARLVARNGRTREAIERFREAEASFLRVGMKLEAALVALDRIEAHLAAHDAASVTRECRTLYERFRAAGLATNALTALAYLTESLSEPAPALAVRLVRTYLERLQDEPALLFLPLP